MLWRAKKSLVNAFEPSSCAAACVGPKIISPSFVNASTTPATSGASGPTIVSSTSLPFAKDTRPAMSLTSIATFSSFGSVAVPALPGATKTVETSEDCAALYASACSRPPPPITSTFINCSVICLWFYKFKCHSIALANGKILFTILVV